MTLVNAFGAIALDATLTNATQKSQIVDGSGNVIGATSNALDVNVKSGAASGTEYTEDAVAVANPAGPIIQLRRRDTLTAAEVTTDGDIITANATSKGELYVKHTDTIQLAAGSALIGKFGIDQTTIGTTNAISIAQLGANTVSTGNGASGTGVLRVAQVNDGTGILATVTSLTQFNGNAIALNTGTRSAGTLRVTIATDDVVPASQSGTWTVQPGNTANTTPWLVTQTPSTSGGLTTYHLVSANTTNATVVKASAGQLYGWYIYNSNASARKLAFHNASSTPTAGASIFFTLMLPASSGANVSFPNGIPFSTGISITTTTGLADNDTAAVGTNDLIINLFYK